MKEIIISFLVMGTFLVVGAAEMQMKLKGTDNLKQFVPNPNSSAHIVLHIPVILDQIPDAVKQSRGIEHYYVVCRLYLDQARSQEMAIISKIVTAGDKTIHMPFEKLDRITANMAKGYKCNIEYRSKSNQSNYTNILPSDRVQSANLEVSNSIE